jgi:hypothetical protein
MRTGRTADGTAIGALTTGSEPLANGSEGSGERVDTEAWCAGFAPESQPPNANHPTATTKPSTPTITVGLFKIDPPRAVSRTAALE